MDQEMTALPKSVGMVALNADIVGYSRLLADDIEATTTAVEEARHLIDEKIGQFGGKLVNFVGDNFMAVFADAKDAVAAAIAISTHLESANADLPESRHLRFRMGLDQGEVAISEENYFGDALNVAARIQEIAPAGGISVSGRVYRALDEPSLRFKSLGMRAMKNIPEEVEVYQFADLPGDGSGRVGTRSLSLESPALAVLPIHTEMVDESVARNAGMIRADLIHRLSRVPQLRVVEAGGDAGASSEAGARYIIESGVHQGRERVRVYANLIDLTTMNVVKSHRWVATADEMFELAERIADEVAKSIEVEVIIGAPAGLYADLNDPEAIEDIYLGWYHLTTGTAEAWSRSIELFGRVAASHPEQPYGTVLSAFANWMAANSGWTRDPAATLQLAMEQAEVGIELGDLTGMATTVKAAVLMSRGKGADALEAIQSSHIVRPTCDATYGLEGSVRRYLGQWDQAVDLVDTAMRLTGVNKPWYPTVKACSLFIGGRVEQAASVAELVLDYQPNNLEALLVLAAAQQEMGLHRRAQATARLIEERFPAVDVSSWLDRNPYQDRAVVDRWKEDLVAAGVMPAG
jgi:adenylate cyclase